LIAIVGETPRRLPSLKVKVKQGSVNNESILAGARAQGMDEAPAPAAMIAAEARIAGRLTVGFLLDIGDMGRMDAPMLDALLFAAVIDANVNRFNRDPALQVAHARLDSAPPNELRRPVSINALAASLRIPFETVRRHINQLIGRGLLVSASNGVYVPTEVVAAPQFVAAMRDRYRRVFSFYDDLRALDLVEPLPCEALPADHPDAPIRAVGRILSDYFFRTLDTLHRQVPDVLTAIVLLNVIRTSSEHIPAAQEAQAIRAGWIPPAERTPVRVAQVSRRLSIPYETTRRHAGWLVDHGFLRREAGGVLLSADYVHAPTLFSITADNLVNARRMFRQIAALQSGLELTREPRASGL
jgi:predicted DNA-binding transcriptional regulator